MDNAVRLVSILLSNTLLCAFIGRSLDWRTKINVPFTA